MDFKHRQMANKYIDLFFSDIFGGSFRDPEALEPYLAIPLLTTVPHIATEAESKRGKWLIFFQVVLLLSASIAVVTLFAVVWYRGYIVL